VASSNSSYRLENLSSPPIFSVVRVARSLVFRVMFCRALFVFWGVGWGALYFLRFITPDYPFAIIKLLFLTVTGIFCLLYQM